MGICAVAVFTSGGRTDGFSSVARGPPYWLLPFPGGGAEKRTHTLWLVFGRSVTPLLGV